MSDYNIRCRIGVGLKRDDRKKDFPKTKEIRS